MSDDSFIEAWSHNVKVAAGERTLLTTSRGFGKKYVHSRRKFLQMEPQSRFDLHQSHNKRRFQTLRLMHICWLWCILSQYLFVTMYFLKARFPALVPLTSQRVAFFNVLWNIYLKKHVLLSNGQLLFNLYYVVNLDKSCLTLISNLFISLVHECSFK